jgi:hypothetical protein
MPTTLEILDTSYPGTDSPPQTTSTTTALYDGCWAASTGGCDWHWGVSAAPEIVVVHDRLAANPINRVDPAGLKFRDDQGTFSVILWSGDLAGPPNPRSENAIVTFTPSEWNCSKEIRFVQAINHKRTKHSYLGLAITLGLATFDFLDGDLDNVIDTSIREGFYHNQLPYYAVQDPYFPGHPQGYARLSDEPTLGYFTTWEYLEFEDFAVSVDGSDAGDTYGSVIWSVEWNPANGTKTLRIKSNGMTVTRVVPIDSRHSFEEHNLKPFSKYVVL